MTFQNRRDEKVNKLEANGITNTGYQKEKVAEVSTSITLSTAHNTIYCTNGSAIQLDLPSSTQGLRFQIKRMGAGSVTIVSANPQTIDGAATLVLSTQYQSVTIIGDGANWFTLAAGSTGGGGGGGASSSKVTADLATSTFQMVGAKSYHASVGYANKHFLIAANYDSASITILSDVSGIGLGLDSGVGLFVSKSANSNTISVKNRTGSSQTIEVYSSYNTSIT